MNCNTIFKLREVKEAILAHPEHLNMWSWFGNDKCGTTACIAGWAISLDAKLETPDYAHIPSNITSYGTHAKGILGISYDEASRLFHVEHWPPQFGAASGYWYRSPADRAQLTADRIEHFIATDGAE